MVSAAGLFVLHFQLVEQETEFLVEFIEGFPVDAVATPGSVYRSC